MSEKRILAIGYGASAVFATLVVLTALLNVWSGDDRWGGTSAILVFPAFVFLVATFIYHDGMKSRELQDKIDALYTKRTGGTK